MTSADTSIATRREFILTSGVMAAATTLPASAVGPHQDKPSPPSAQPPRTEDSTSDDAGAITEATFAEAEKLAGVEFTDKERTQMLRGIKGEVARYRRRRAQALPNGLGPAAVFDPRFPGATLVDVSDRLVRSDASPGPLPSDDEDIAFAPVTTLSRWIQRRQLTSRRLTQIYLKRLKEIGPKLESVVTLTADRALRQAAKADNEIAAGQYRGPLHGIPWGAKDLLDSAGIKTTWGATPYKDRVPDDDAAVVKRLDEAGAVLVAKTTLG
ncbi:MAG: amidase family protein, partial [Phycisphaerales bacterium]